MYIFNGVIPLKERPPPYIIQLLKIRIGMLAGYSQKIAKKCGKLLFRTSIKPAVRSRLAWMKTISYQLL